MEHPSNPQRILITGPDTVLGTRLVRELSRIHGVTSLPDTELADRGRVARLTADATTIVHLVHEPPGIGDDSGHAALDRATRGTYDLLTTGQVGRCILVSSLRHLRHYPATIAVNERFRPNPAPTAEDLIPHLAELTLREVSRVRPVEGIVLRVGQVTDPEAQRKERLTSLALHIDDAVQGVVRALAYRGTQDEPPTRFRTFHIVDDGSGSRFRPAAASEPAFGYAPRFRLTDGFRDDHPPSQPERRVQSRPAIQRITMYGAGGPLGAIAATVLAPRYTLRLTDLRPVADLAVAPPQSPGAPVLTELPPPHEHQVVDVVDTGAVMAAAEGADALINCTVLRRDPVGAFNVNVIGALNVVRAAVAHGVRRVVHTGPLLTLLPHPAGYHAEFALHDDLPPRPGDDLYFVSKFLGQEICRIFAEAHDLEVPSLLFCSFVEPSLPPRNRERFLPFAVSWADSATAVACALEVRSLPRPFEPFHILADLPHGKYTNAKARSLLGWQPQDDLADHWRSEEHA